VGDDFGEAVLFCCCVVWLHEKEVKKKIPTRISKIPKMNATKQHNNKKERLRKNRPPKPPSTQLRLDNKKRKKHNFARFYHPTY
jgi:hypothetical protein